MPTKQCVQANRKEEPHFPASRLNISRMYYYHLSSPSPSSPAGAGKASPASLPCWVWARVAVTEQARGEELLQLRQGASLYTMLWWWGRDCLGQHTPQPLAINVSCGNSSHIKKYHWRIKQLAQCCDMGLFIQRYLRIFCDFQRSQAKTALACCVVSGHLPLSLP